MGAAGFLGAELLIMPEMPDFSIEREDAIVEDQTFTTVAAANVYFNDRVLDLGPIKSGLTGTLDLTFLLQMITISGTLITP